MKISSMLDDLKGRYGSFAVMPLREKLGVLSEGTWLLLILLLPVYFNPLCYNPYYFAKALALVFLVSLLLGLVLAQWFLAPTAVKVRELPAIIIRKSPLQFAALVLGLMWVASTVLSVMPGRSLWGNLAQSEGFLPNLAWIIFFLIIAQKVKGRSQVYRALYALLISSAVVSLLGILQFFSPGILPGRQYEGRVFSTDSNPLSLSGFLSTTLPITLAFIALNWYGWGSRQRSWLKLTALFALFGLQLCCLVFAQYSITLLLFVIGIIVFLTLIGIFLRRKAILALSISAMLLLAVIGGVLLGQLMFRETTAPSMEGQNAGAPVAEQVGLPTLSIRVQNWRCAIDVMTGSPEIPFNPDSFHYLRRFIGYGPETFVATSQLKFPSALKSSYTSQALLITQPENHYLYLGVTLGILGLLAFLALLTVFFLMGLRMLSRSKDKEVIVLAAGSVAAIAQYCAHIFFDPSRIVPELVFWTVLGLMVALAQVDAAGISAGCSADKTAHCIEIAASRPGKMRKLMSVLIVIVFVAVGGGLTLPLMLSNIKVQDGFNLWDSNPNLSLAAFTEATLVGPDQANYHDFLGVKAFTMARDDKTYAGVKSRLLALSELAGNTAIQIEPQLALWRYRLADREMYRIIDASVKEKAKILYLYEEAAQLFPGNAAILNKWALALILTGDYDEAGQKLLESEKNDPSLLQTSYLKGLLSAHEGRAGEAGGLFISQAGARLENIANFIRFCGQVAPFGEIGRVKDAMEAYTRENNSDWKGLTLLGVTHIYLGSPADALADFKMAAMNVPDRDAAVLAPVVEGSLIRYPDFRDESGEIVRRLMERAAKAR